MKRNYQKPCTAGTELYSEQSVLIRASLPISSDETGKMLAPERTYEPFEEEEER